MKISVIVPAYNVQKYLKRCIESLLSQNYKIYELIIVDDGSTDGTAEIADKFAEKYDFIKVIHKRNAGLGMARNTGIDNATGEYLLFLDSDDYFNSDLIMHFVEAAKENYADALISGYEKVDESGQITGRLQYAEAYYQHEEIQREFLPRMLGSLPSISDSISMGATNVLYNAEIIRKYKIRFVSEREYISEDIVFNILFYLKAKNVYLLSHTDYKYQTTINSLTTKYREDRLELSKNLYKCVTNIVDKNNMSSEYILRFQKSMFNYVRMCLAQEKHDISNHSKKEQCDAIKAICEDNLISEICAQYPIAKLGFAQRVFLWLVKYRRIQLLRILIEKGFISVK